MCIIARLKPYELWNQRNLQITTTLPIRNHRVGLPLTIHPTASDLDEGRCNDFSTPNGGQLLLFDVKRAIASVRANRQQNEAVRRVQLLQRKQQEQEAAQKAHIVRMKQYLASDDPVLMGEAMQWLQDYPEQLDEVL